MLALNFVFENHKGAFSISSISWVERKIASAIFGTPPHATYNIALKYFIQAESVSPGFWKKNQLMISQCHFNLGDKESARKWLSTAKSIPIKTEEDQTAENEIDKLLQKV